MNMGDSEYRKLDFGLTLHQRPDGALCRGHAPVGKRCRECMKMVHAGPRGFPEEPDGGATVRVRWMRIGDQGQVAGFATPINAMCNTSAYKAEVTPSGGVYRNWDVLINVPTGRLTTVELTEEQAKRRAEALLAVLWMTGPGNTNLDD